MTENVEEEIISIIADVSGVDEKEINLDSDLVKDLEIDSIKAIEIVVAAEKKYRVSIRDEDIPQLATVKQIVDLTKELMNKKQKVNEERQIE
ncbi:MAG: phosphopantetheine-binding protein [Nitrospirota bacterium]|jgi:acyl carrier protein